MTTTLVCVASPECTFTAQLTVGHPMPLTAEALATTKANLLHSDTLAVSEMLLLPQTFGCVLVSTI